MKATKVPSKKKAQPEVVLKAGFHNTHLCQLDNGSTARCVRISKPGVRCKFVFDSSKEQGVIIYSPLRNHVVVIDVKSKE